MVPGRQDVIVGGKLVRLNPDEADKSASRRLYPPGRRANVDDRVALVTGFDLDRDVGAENLFFPAGGQKPIDAGETVRGNGGQAPLDHIAVVVIVRRLDENNPERPLLHGALALSARAAPTRSGRPIRASINQSKSSPRPWEPARHST